MAWRGMLPGGEQRLAACAAHARDGIVAYHKPRCWRLLSRSGAASGGEAS